MEAGEVKALKLGWAKFLEHIANRAPWVVAMEACGGAQRFPAAPAKTKPAPGGRVAGGRSLSSKSGCY